MKITKDELLKLIEDLPNEFSVEELFERLVLFSKIKIGSHQSRNNVTHSTEEARKQLRQWLQ